MQIDSRVSDIPREVQYNAAAGSVANRQRSVTSDPGGNASKGRARASRNTGGGRPDQPKMEAIDLKVAVEKLNQMIRDQQRDVAFSVDEEANTTVIKVIKSETGELIKQFPPEEILAMKAKIRKSTGWLVDKKA